MTLDSKKTMPDAKAPPVAKKIASETRIHGHALPDPYAWMRKKTDPAVTRYLEEENSYADAVLAPTAALQKTLYDEMVSHIRETDVNVPYKKGPYYYYSRWEAGKQYPIYGRKEGSLEAAEQVTLDVNALAAGESFMEIGAYEISDDGKLLAYSTDNTGFRQYTLRLRDLATGKDLPDTAEKTGAVAWDASNKVIYYTVEDEAKRQYRLYRHALGTTAAHDTLVYEEKDERFRVSVDRSRSGKFLFLTVESHTTSEVRVLDVALQQGISIEEWRLIEPRVQDIEYYADHNGPDFYIRVNDKGRNFRLVRASIANPGKGSWVEVVPCRDDVMLMDVDLFETFYVRYERAEGLPRLTVVELESGKEQKVSFPEPVYTAGPQANREFSTRVYRYSYQSLVTPYSVYDFDLATGLSALLKQNEVPGGYDPALYESKRLWVKARDGVKVPVSVIYRKDKKTEGRNPLHIYGYGSYGYSLPVTFSSNRLCLLDRGFVLALAHVRGGGDLGKKWHDDGRLMNKMNSFTDFIDVTEYLVAEKYGARDKVAAEGASAGGLLVSVAANLRPDLFRAVQSDVPFVDVMNTMLDASLPLTVGEYEEWGNPNEKPACDYMMTYSPYDNIKKAAYPALLVRASFNDSQVPYWEAAKYVARLRAETTGDNVILLKTDMSSGHGGASGRYDYLKDIAFDDAFLLVELGVVPKG